MPITAIAILPIKEGMYAKAISTIEETLPESHKESGILRLAFHKSESGEGLLVAVESYRHEDAITTHGATSHLKKVIETLPLILGGPLEVFRFDPYPAGDPVIGAVAPNPPAGRLPTGLTVLSMFTVKEGALDRVLDLLAEDAVATHLEKGVHRFAIHTDRAFPRRIIVVEAYENGAVLESHYKTPHLAKIMRELPPLLESENRLIRLTPLNIGDSQKGGL